MKGVVVTVMICYTERIQIKISQGKRHIGQNPGGVHAKSFQLFSPSRVINSTNFWERWHHMCDITHGALPIKEAHLRLGVQGLYWGLFMPLVSRFFEGQVDAVCVCAHSVVSNSLQSHGLQPTWLLWPWDSPGKNTGVVVKNLPANVGDMGSIPGWGRSPGEGNGNPLQYSCLGNPMDRGAWWATGHGVAKSRTQLRD